MKIINNKFTASTTRYVTQESLRKLLTPTKGRSQLKTCSLCSPKYHLPVVQNHFPPRLSSLIPSVFPCSAILTGPVFFSMTMLVENVLVSNACTLFSTSIFNKFHKIVLEQKAIFALSNKIHQAHTLKNGWPELEFFFCCCRPVHSEQWFHWNAFA